jgi:predicted nucleic acid-binding Zn finger protein
VIFGTKTRVYVSNESNFIITSSVAISCMSIVFDVGMFNWYRCKWIDYSNVWKNKFYNISRIDGR